MMKVIPHGRYTKAFRIGFPPYNRLYFSRNATELKR